MASHQQRKPRRSEAPALSGRLTAVPVTAMLAAIQESRVVANPDSSFFSGACVRPFSLRFDRPERIVGCKVREGTVEYAVLFRCGPPMYAGFAITTHEELMAAAPWLLADYIISQSSKNAT